MLNWFKNMFRRSTFQKNKLVNGALKSRSVSLFTVKPTLHNFSLAFTVIDDVSVTNLYVYWGKKLEN